MVSSTYISPETYLKEERLRDERFEYENGNTIPMGGASKEHNRIIINIIGELFALTKKQESFGVYAQDLRVFCPSTQKYYYPDLIITVEEEDYLDSHFDTLTNPKVIIEVLSEHTESRDRGIKFEAYRSIESFQEYLLVSQKKHCVEAFHKNESGEWIIDAPLHNLTDTYHFRSFDYQLSLADIYQKVTLAPIATGKE